MRQRLLLAAGLILAGAAGAYAQDEKILGRDDVAFAQALVDNHYPDLAKRFLVVLAKNGKGGDAKPAIEAINLGVAQDDAQKIDDLIKRKEALVKVLRDKEKFIDDYKGTQPSEDMRNTLPDLVNLIGETFKAAIKKETDDKKIEALRTEGDGIFVQAEAGIQARIDALKALNAAPDSEDYARLRNARYNQPRLRYFHALLFAQGSGKRKDLCDQAEREYEEFDLDFYTDVDTPPVIYWAYIDVGLCLKELGKNKEAIGSFEKVIQQRESYGPIDPKTKTWPIPAGSDVVELVCIATLQKVVLLTDAKELAEAVKTGRDYFATMPRPFETSMSMALAKALGDAQLDLGDSKGASDTAKMMIKVDEVGYGGAAGRDILERAGGGGSSYVEKLRNAETKLAENKCDPAIAVCRQVLADVAGTADEQEGGCAAWLWIGFAFQKRGLNDEASLAYQTGLDRYPRAKDASELLSREIDCLQAANGWTKSKYYKDRITAAMDRLVADYPNAPQAADIQMKKAGALESDGKWQDAIEIYKRVEKASNNYTKARLKIGLDYNQLAVTLAGEKPADPKATPDKAAEEKRAAEVASLYALADAAFKETIQAAVEKSTAPGHTLDTKILAALDDHEYLRDPSLARLYMSEAYGKKSDAVAMIAKLEQKWSSDPVKGPDIQNLRGRLYLDQGLFDDAEKWVEDLYRRDKKKASGPASMLAQAYDQQGAEKRQAKPGSAEADKLWAKAEKYYWWSVELQVDGTVSQQPDVMKRVGDRLYVYGLAFNGISESRVSFVDWPDSAKAPEYWTKAAKIYEAALTQTPDYRMTINLGRTYGFLAKWTESAGVYAKLFEQEQVLDKKKQKLDASVIKAKPELSFAYLEWGVAEQMAAQTIPDEKERTDRLNRCINTIFLPLNFTLKADSSPAAYWGTEYHLVRALMDRGLYNDADAKVKDLQRAVSLTFDDGKFGYQKLFEATIEELKQKLRK